MNNFLDIIKQIKQEKLSLSMYNIAQFAKKHNIFLSPQQVLPLIKDTHQYIIPENIITIVKNLVDYYNPNKILNYSSNYGELISCFDKSKEIIGVEEKSNCIDYLNHFYPEFVIEHCNPIYYTTNNKFDCVVSVPPFGKKEKFNNKKIYSVEVYINQLLSMLKPKGTGIFIVPVNFLDVYIFKDIRNKILNEYRLKSIIKLPNKSFPYTSIDIFIIIIENYKDSSNYSVSFYDTFKDLNSVYHINNNSEFTISKNNLINRWGYKYHDPKSKSYELDFKGVPTKRLIEMDITLIHGNSYLNKISSSNVDLIPIIGYSNFDYSDITLNDNTRYISKNDLNPKTEQLSLLQTDDIVLSFSTKNQIKVYLHTGKSNLYVINTTSTILRGNDAEYIYKYLSKESGFNHFKTQISRQSSSLLQIHGLKNILNDILIPILPISDLTLTLREKVKLLSRTELEKLAIESITNTDYSKISFFNSPSKTRGIGLLDAIKLVIEYSPEKSSDLKKRLERKKDLPIPLGKNQMHSQRLLYDCKELVEFIIEHEPQLIVSPSETVELFEKNSFKITTKHRLQTAT